MPESLTPDEVRHIARLARLNISEAELETYREQLSDIIDHVATLSELDLSGVEPMARPNDLTNRLDEDDVTASMPLEHVKLNAPAMEGRFIAVPKVLGDEG